MKNNDTAALPNLHYLLKLSWLEIKNLDKKRTVVMLPVSPIEEHGPHLPVGTDVFGANDIARGAAEYLCSHSGSVEVVIAPAIPLGCAPITADFPGTLSISGRTFSKLLVEICEGLVSSGFQYIVIVNHHLDSIHLKAIVEAIEKVEQKHDVKIVESAGRILYSGIRLNEVEEGKRLGLNMKTEIHGDIRETSYILHSYPELMKQDYEKLKAVRVDVRQGLEEGKKTFKEMGAVDGYIGSPAYANKELGRIHIDEQAKLVAEMAAALLHGGELPEMSPSVTAYLKNRVNLT